MLVEGCRVRSGVPPPEVDWTAGREGGSVQE